MWSQRFLFIGCGDLFQIVSSGKLFQSGDQSLPLFRGDVAEEFLVVFISQRGESWRQAASGRGEDDVLISAVPGRLSAGTSFFCSRRSTSFDTAPRVSPY